MIDPPTGKGFEKGSSRCAEETIKKVQKKVDKDQAVAKLQEDLEELKKSNQDLKSRLEELEAKGRA